MTISPFESLPSSEGEFLLQNLAPDSASCGSELWRLRGSNPAKWLHGDLADEAAVSALDRIIETRAGESGGLVGTVDYCGRFCFGLYNRIETDVAGGAPPAPPSTRGGPAGKVESFPGRADYVAIVRAAKEEIAAGNIYQVNLARRYRVRWRGDPAALYLALTKVSPAPFGALIRQPHRTIISASPELFLRIRGGRVVTRPIKGTRPRGVTAEEDARLLAELKGSAKERAELVMITDLLRNDLGRVCKFGTVRVEGLAEAESFPQVHHLVSTISGSVRPGLGPFHVLASTFPGGSITGAPKIRAMQVIAALEPFDRGLFTGAIGVVTFGGDCDFSIAIRTAVHQVHEGVGLGEGEILYHAGSGIVADSDPDAEFDETVSKASGFLEAIEVCRRGA